MNRFPRTMLAAALVAASAASPACAGEAEVPETAPPGRTDREDAAQPTEGAPANPAPAPAPLPPPAPPPTAADEPQAPPPSPPASDEPKTPPKEPAKDDGAPNPGAAPPAKPDAPPPPDKAPVADAEGPTAEQDAAARKFLSLAAERQGGATLVPPAGHVGSFRVVFGKVTLHREERDAAGNVTRRRMDSEDPGLVTEWKGGQIRTAWRLAGERATTRGLLMRCVNEETQEVPWLDDGTGKPTILLGAKYAKDRDEIERDRRIVRSLLDVAVLRRLLADGSRWRVVEDALHKGTAIERTPPAGAASALRLTLWIDPATHDVTAARLPSAASGEPTLHFELEYDDEFPAVKDRVLRFPFRFTVKEQRAGSKETVPVMVATAREASFNDVDDSVFFPPKR